MRGARGLGAQGVQAADELKSHLFLVHFSVVFHLKINNYYTEI